MKRLRAVAAITVGMGMWIGGFLCFAFVPACATTQKIEASISDAGVGSTVAVTCTSLNAFGQSFLATGTVLDAAFDARLITSKNYLPWREFALRFQAAYKIADKACEAAVKSNDQTVQGVIAAEMGAFQGELGQFITQAAHIGTDGGTP